MMILSSEGLLMPPRRPRAHAVALVIRLPPRLHARCTRAAVRANLSLNRWIVGVLEAATSTRKGA